MRVAFVSLGALARVSGGFLYDRLLIEGLRARGVVVDVVELPFWSYRRALLSHLGPWRGAPRGYDVVIEDQLAHPALLGRNRVLRAGGAKVVSLVHNLTSAQPGTRARRLVRWCERGYFRSVDGVIAVCAGTLADVRACGGEKLPALVANPGGDHIPAIDARVIDGRAEQGPLRLLFVGVVAPHKGLHRLLPVLARLRELDVTLDVAGALDADPAYAAAMRAEIAAHGLGDRVTLHGELARPALTRLFAASHALVMPSDREAYPLAAVEGFAAGLPALLTDAGGTAELVGPADAVDPPAWRLAPDDHWAWARAIALLASNRDRLARMARAARARHAQHGTWSATAARVHDWLSLTFAPGPAVGR